MENYQIIYLGAAVVLFVFTVGAVALAKSAWARVLVVLLAATGFLVAYEAPYKLLSFAKPASMESELKDLQAAPFIWARVVRGEPIEVLYEIDEKRRLYSYPWNDELAQSIVDTMQQAQQQGGVPMMGKPFSGAQGQLGSITDAIGEMLEGLTGGEGEGEGEGEGNGEGEGDRPGEGVGHGLEDRNSPIAYPAQPPPLPPKQSEKR